jgi:hypothetical protein
MKRAEARAPRISVKIDPAVSTLGFNLIANTGKNSGEKIVSAKGASENSPQF